MSILESRRQMLISTLKGSESLSLTAAYLIALWLCLPEGDVVLKGEEYYFSLHFVVVNLVELLVIAAIHRIRFDESQLSQAHLAPRSSRDQIIAYVMPMILDVMVMYLFWVSFGAQSRLFRFLGVYVAVYPLLNHAIRLVSFRLMKSRMVMGYDQINVLVVGSNIRGYEFYLLSKRDRFLSVNVVGFLDDENRCGHEIPLLGTLDDFTDVLRAKAIDTIVICLPIRTYYDSIMGIIREGEKQGVVSHYMTTLFSTRISQVECSLDKSGNFLLIPSTADQSFSHVAKRIFDVGFALTLLPLTLPLMFLAAICIKIEDGGRIVFEQHRVGFGKRVFTLFKMRTMVMDAEKRHLQLEGMNEMDGPVFKIRNDPRITKVGRILRKYNIDELPQLFNVLRGEMSVVGPRPMSLRDYNRLTDDWARRRFSVKPGLTCTWQIRPHRNSMSFMEWMDLDMRYIDNQSFLGDIQICLLTVPAVFRGTGV